MRTSAQFTSVGSRASISATFGGNALFDVQYTRDSVDRVVQAIEVLAGDTARLVYSYDPAGRLQNVTRNGQAREAYEYDANGNRTREVVPSGVSVNSYDARDRLLSSGSIQYAYTPDGFLALRTSGSDASTFAFTEMGDLREVVLTGNRSITYTTDGLGRRIAKNLNGAMQRGWLYDGQFGLVAETDGTNSVISRFVYGEREDVPDYMLKNGRTYRLITDQLGSVRLVVDVADGAVAQRIDYDAFGVVTANTNPGFQPFAYAGGVLDEDTHLTHFGARDYDAAIGRWISKDPILFAGNDANLYAYVANDPVNMRDPSGHDGTLPETNAAQDLNEELEKDKTEQDMKKKDQAMSALCNQTLRAAAGAENAHHSVFKVFGGRDRKINFLFIPRVIHMGFHGIVDGMLVAAGLPKIGVGKAEWTDLLTDPAKKAKVKSILLAAATSFDLYCSQFSKPYAAKSTPGNGPQSMREVMERYMADEKW